MHCEQAAAEAREARGGGCCEARAAGGQAAGAGCEAGAAGCEASAADGCEPKARDGPLDGGGIIRRLLPQCEEAWLLLSRGMHAGGAGCCHVCVSPGGEHVIAANYNGGSIVAIRRAADGSLDPSCVQYIVLPPSSEGIKFPGPNAPRQESAHAHMCIFSAGTDNTTVLVPDLGSDLVWSIPYNASSKSTPLGAPVATAAGPAAASGLQTLGSAAAGGAATLVNIAALPIASRSAAFWQLALAFVCGGLFRQDS